MLHRLERTGNPQQVPYSANERIGGSAFAGIAEMVRSPYLLGVGMNF